MITIGIMHRSPTGDSLSIVSGQLRDLPADLNHWKKNYRSYIVVTDGLLAIDCEYLTANLDTGVEPPLDLDWNIQYEAFTIDKSVLRNSPGGIVC